MPPKQYLILLGTHADFNKFFVVFKLPYKVLTSNFSGKTVYLEAVLVGLK